MAGREAPAVNCSSSRAIVAVASDSLSRSSPSSCADRQLSPFGLAAIDALAPVPGETILDIGCGAGQSVLQLAERVGPDGQVVGVDIAAPLLALARQRATGFGQVRVIEANVASLDLPDACADAMFSRFGVMRFADRVAAFAHFHRLLKPSGRLAFVCWRSLAENELDLLPLAAAGLEADADAAAFAFAKPAVTRRVLGAAGFADVAIAPHDRAASCGGLAEAVAVLLKLGALGKIVRETPGLCDAVEPRLRAALEPRVTSNGVALGAAVWIVTAPT